jgi:hypothetical protein
MWMRIPASRPRNKPGGGEAETKPAAGDWADELQQRGRRDCFASISRGTRTVGPPGRSIKICTSSATVGVQDTKRQRQDM